ncbi:hypothetical protein Pcinc_043578 [Petrolisthes cinctipes]|uniref:Uncharacterized protein n=1 Tax=Petrolisthes cinctipes TaxID=88211 RepID=A0AAE1BFN2_PETCI|nr:hypothetical protein Pcinc_043578 [Petrolisthes cinctipes]
MVSDKQKKVLGFLKARSGRRDRDNTSSKNRQGSLPSPPQAQQVTLEITTFGSVQLSRYGPGGYKLVAKL